MDIKKLIENLEEWHENAISELCADDQLTCDDLCGCRSDCIVLQAIKALRVLAAYEDTGMTPEQIRNAQETLRCFDDIGIKRGNEIVTAEEEGRLVVLPCKIDTPIYLLRSKKEPRKPTKYWAEEYDIDHFTIGGTMIPMITACSKENEWEELIDGTLEGAEFFLSREAAEKVIAKEADK